MILQWVPYTHLLDLTKNILLFLLFQLSMHSWAVHQALLLLMMINDILPCWLWSQVSQTAQLGLPHHGSLPPTVSLCSPLPVPFWTDKLESGDFLKWVKTKETHSSSDSDPSGHVFVVWAAASPYVWSPSVKPAPKLQSSRPRVLTPGNPEGLKIRPKPSQKQRFLVIEKWNFSYLRGWGDAAEQRRPRTLNHPSEETGPPPWSCLEAMMQACCGVWCCTGPCRGTSRSPANPHTLTRQGKGDVVSLTFLCLRALGCLVNSRDPFLE